MRGGICKQECEGAAGKHSASLSTGSPPRIAIFPPAVPEGRAQAAGNAEVRPLASTTPQAATPHATALPAIPWGPILPASAGVSQSSLTGDTLPDGNCHQVFSLLQLIRWASKRQGNRVSTVIGIF